MENYLPVCSDISLRRYSKSITLTLVRKDVPIPYTRTFKDPNLARKFIKKLATKIANEDAVNQILASNEIVDMFSMLDYVREFMSVNVKIEETEPNIFTVVDTQGSTLDGCRRPIVFTEASFTLVQNTDLTTVFDLSDTFEDNLITDLGVPKLQRRVWDDYGFMCTLVCVDRVPVLRMLLDRNVDVNQSVSEPTPFQLACLLGREEIVAMFVYYNVTPIMQTVKPVPVSCFGISYYRHPPVLYSSRARMDETINEMLIDYSLDKWSDFDVDFLLQLMLNASPHLDKVLEMLCKHAHTMASFFVSHSKIEEVWAKRISTFMHVKPAYFKRALGFFSRYRTACDAFIGGFQSEHWVSYWTGSNIHNKSERGQFFKNLYILGDTFFEEADEPKPTFLQMMLDKLREPLVLVTTACHRMKLSYAEIEPLILLLLANNAPMDSFSYDYIFRNCIGRPDHFLFDACRLMEVDYSMDELRLPGNPHVSSYYYRFDRGHRTIMEVLRDPNILRDSDMAFYGQMSSHPLVKEKTVSMLDRFPEVSIVLDGFPEFQTLLELARDAARGYVIEKYKVETGIQFEAALKKLKIPEYIKKVIAYDMREPLYNEMALKILMNNL